MSERWVNTKTEKRCYICKNIFPRTTEFYYSDKHSSDGLASKCKECTKKMAMERFEKSKVLEIESLEGEIWKDINGYEGMYRVSNLGRVLSLNGNYKILRQNVEREYYKVRLSRENKSKAKSVHRLVAEAFIPNPNNLPMVNHKDENKLNNKYDNLEWCTCKYNLNYGNAQAKRVKKQSKKVYQYDLDMNLIKIWDNSMNIKRELGLDNSSIGKCCKGIGGSSGGFIWSYEPINEIPKNIHTKRVYQYDENYKLIKIWNSAKETEEENYNKGIVSKFCNGNYGWDTYKGYIWTHEKFNIND